jgi:hypothetical protein
MGGEKGEPEGTVHIMQSSGVIKNAAYTLVD